MYLGKRAGTREMTWVMSNLETIRSLSQTTGLAPEEVAARLLTMRFRKG
jgi:hypothetical protein